MRFSLKSILLGMTISTSVFAYDLGVVGNTFPIKEPSLFATLAFQMLKVDWKNVDKNIAEDAKKKLHNMKYADLTLAQEDKLRLVDPTVIIQQDITAPTLDGGTVILAKKGQKVNPLDYARPVTKMFFFDPSDEEQLQLALAEDKKHPNQIYLIAVGGDIADLAEKLNKPIFYAYDKIIKKLNVQHFPSLVGTKGKNIAIAEFVTINQKKFKEFWNEMD